MLGLFFLFLFQGKQNKVIKLKADINELKNRERIEINSNSWCIKKKTKMQMKPYLTNQGGGKKNLEYTK